MHKQFKMADVIDTYMKQRMVNEFPTSEEVSLLEIHRHLNSVYGEHTVRMSTVRHWVRHFKSGETQMRDKAQSGWPAAQSQQTITAVLIR
jgi:hypothetical protein